MSLPPLAPLAPVSVLQAEQSACRPSHIMGGIPHAIIEPTEDQQVKLSQLTSDEWVQTAALMFAAGMSIELVCLRTGRPKRMVEGLMASVEFVATYKSIARDMKRDTTADLVKGSGPDNVLFLIETRDNRQVKMCYRMQAAIALLRLGYGNKVLSAMSEQNQPELTGLVDKHGSVEKGVDMELKRIITNTPGLLAMLEQDVLKPRVAETRQQSDTNSGMLTGLSG